MNKLLATRVRQLREAQGLRQDEVAARARGLGLRWSRGTVAAIENGRRAIPLGETLLLPRLFEVDETELFRVDDDVVVDLGGPKLPAATFRALIAREPGVDPRPVKRKLSDEGQAAVDLKEKYGLSERQAIDALLKQSEADVTAAKRLNVEPLEVAFAARAKWKRGLVAERDHRVGPAGPGSGQGVRRGHMTRLLIQELGEEIERRTAQ